MTPRHRRLLLRTLAVIVGVGILLLLVGFGLFRSDPSWYRPVQLTEAQQAAGQQRLLDRIATLRNAVGRSKARVTTTHPAWPPFEIELKEEEVNGVLMRWASTEPHLRQALRYIEEPHVRFLSDRIEFAGRASGSIVSIELSVTQTEEGPRVQLGRPWWGRLPMSRGLVKDAGETAFASLRDSKSGVPKGIAEAVAALTAGDVVEPVFPIPSSVEGEGLLRARVEKLTIDNGVLKATLRPME